MVHTVSSVQVTLVEDKEDAEDTCRSSSDEEREKIDEERDTDKTTQRILTIMADFIDGEVNTLATIPEL